MAGIPEWQRTDQQQHGNRLLRNHLQTAQAIKGLPSLGVVNVCHFAILVLFEIDGARQYAVGPRGSSGETRPRPQAWSRYPGRSLQLLLKLVGFLRRLAERGDALRKTLAECLFRFSGSPGGSWAEI